MQRASDFFELLRRLEEKLVGGGGRGGREIQLTVVTGDESVRKWKGYKFVCFVGVYLHLYNVSNKKL